MINKPAEEEAQPAMVAEGRAPYQADGAEGSADTLSRAITELEKQMKAAAAELEFEKAAMLRDQIRALQTQLDLLDERPEWERIQSQ